MQSLKLKGELFIYLSHNQSRVSLNDLTAPLIATYYHDREESTIYRGAAGLTAEGLLITS